MQNQFGNNMQNYNPNQAVQMNQRMNNMQYNSASNLNVGNNAGNVISNTNNKNSITMLFNVLAIIVITFYSVYAILDVISLTKIQYIIRNLLVDFSHGIFYGGVLLGIGQIYEKIHLK